MLRTLFTEYSSRFKEWVLKLNDFLVKFMVKVSYWVNSVS